MRRDRSVPSSTGRWFIQQRKSVANATICRPIELFQPRLSVRSSFRTCVGQLRSTPLRSQRSVASPVDRRISIRVLMRCRCAEKRAAMTTKWFTTDALTAGVCTQCSEPPYAQLASSRTQWISRVHFSSWSPLRPAGSLAARCGGPEGQCLREISISISRFGSPAVIDCVRVAAVWCRSAPVYDGNASFMFA